MEVAWSPDAVDDIEAAVDYISHDLGSPRAAARLSESVFEKARLLAEFPRAGSSLRTWSGVDTGYRFVVCENWIVFFRLEESRALIVRILYGKSDYMRTLFGEIDDEG